MDQAKILRMAEPRSLLMTLLSYWINSTSGLLFMRKWIFFIVWGTVSMVLWLAQESTHYLVFCQMVKELRTKLTTKKHTKFIVICFVHLWIPVGFTCMLWILMNTSWLISLDLCTVNILSWVDYFHPASTVPWVKIIAQAAQIYHCSGKNSGWTSQWQQESSANSYRGRETHAL